MMTPWKDVAGKACELCDKPATHYYGDMLICCECHGGGLVSHEEAEKEHAKVLAEREARHELEKGSDRTA